MALFLFCVGSSSVLADALPVEKLEIRLTDGRVETFNVEVADTSEERSVGLMNREEMADDHGMLFDFGETRMVYMWMKNTYLPLDMLFISVDGKVVHVKNDALPLSESLIDSRMPVRYVLEINGGLAARKKLVVGSDVQSSTIDRQKANP